MLPIQFGSFLHYNLVRTGDEMTHLGGFVHTVQIVFIPSASGNPVTKSIATWSHFLFGSSNGMSVPVGFWWLDFSIWHTRQCVTKLVHPRSFASSRKFVLPGPTCGHILDTLSTVHNRFLLIPTSWCHGFLVLLFPNIDISCLVPLGAFWECPISFCTCSAAD